MNARGAALHVLGDALGSVAALASGLVIALTGWTPIDPIASAVIGVLIAFSSLRLLREAVHALMEGAPMGLSLEEVGREMAAVEGVESVHDLHVWTLSGSRTALSAHVLVRDLARWDSTLHALQALTTLNETLYMEASRELAKRTITEGGDDEKSRITYAVRRCLSREPRPEELAVLADFLARQQERFPAEGADPWPLIADEKPADGKLAINTTPPDLAAWTALSRVVLNLDETITKE
jgi:hypothetical protein